MQPQESNPRPQSVVFPTSGEPTVLTPSSVPPPAAPIVTNSMQMTDQMILHENARVYNFENGISPMPKQHKILAFFGLHKRTMAISLISLIVMFLIAVPAFIKIQSLSKSPVGQLDITTDSRGGSSAGGSAASDSSSDATDFDTTTEDDTSTFSDDYDEVLGDDEEYTDGYDEEYSEEYDDTGASEEYDETTEEDPTYASPVTVPTPTATPTKPATKLAHRFTTASWNTSTGNPRDVGSQVLTLMKNTQILGLQELRGVNQRNSVKYKVLCPNCAYSGYQPSYAGSAPGDADYTIIWNKTAFKQVGTGSSRKMCDGAKSATYSYSPRSATWVRLQSKVNGKQIIVVNTHLMGLEERNGKPGTDTVLISRYKTHMTNLTKLLAELKSSNVPIYITGTFNVNYRFDKNAYTSWFPYASMKTLGIRSNWDVMNLQNIASTAGTATSGNRIVDYVFSLQRNDVSANAIAIASSKYGSDNSPVFYTTTIK